MFILCDSINDNGYPIADTNIGNVTYIGEIKSYKKMFGYETVKQTSIRLKAKFDYSIAAYFGLENDPRFYENESFSKRKWNQMSMPFQCRATMLMEYFAGNQNFSLPNKSFLTDIWLTERYKEIWKFCNIINIIVLVDKDNSHWINKIT